MNVQFLGCFASDHRLSMNIYANEFTDAVRNEGYDSSLYCPSHRLESFAESRFIMRYLRYLSYPLQVRLLNKSADVYHVVDHGYAHLHDRLPSGLSVVTVHDLIPYMTWQGKIPINDKVGRPTLNLYSLSFVKKFDRIIAVSESTANDLSEVLNIDRNRIEVVPNIIAEHFKPQLPEKEQLFRHDLLDDPDTKLIMLTGREHYKNLETSLKVLNGLINSGHKVKIIRTGTPDSEFLRLVDQYYLSDYVSCLWLENHADLALVYGAADCLLFPSWYEGFGMPVIEALACGTPVVSSNVTSLVSIGGQLSLTAPPDDVDALSDHVITCLYNRAHQEKVTYQGPRWAEKYRSKAVMNRLLDVYDL